MLKKVQKPVTKTLFKRFYFLTAGFRLLTLWLKHLHLFHLNPYAFAMTVELGSIHTLRRSYADRIIAIMGDVYRVLKNIGTFW